MVNSTCPKCDGKKFETVTPDKHVLESKYKYTFVQCAKCGAVVGVIDAYHLPTLINLLSAKIGGAG